VGRGNHDDDIVCGGFPSLAPIGRVVGVTAAMVACHVHCYDL